MGECVNEKPHKKSWEAQMGEHTNAKTQQKLWKTWKKQNTNGIVGETQEEEDK